MGYAGMQARGFRTRPVVFTRRQWHRQERIKKKKKAAGAIVLVFCFSNAIRSAGQKKKKWVAVHYGPMDLGLAKRAIQHYI